VIYAELVATDCERGPSSKLAKVAIEEPRRARSVESLEGDSEEAELIDSMVKAKDSFRSWLHSSAQQDRATNFPPMWVACHRYRLAR